MKSILMAGLLWIFTCFSLVAGEGMWLPLLLGSLNESEMQSMGMKMTAEDIYSVNQGSLKDAIVHFGGFCTGEVISSQGLVLTNHHCGFGQIQSHSTLENNYIDDGFWAMNLDEELPNPGLFVTFIVRIEDVTDKVLSAVPDDIEGEAREGMKMKFLENMRTDVEKEPYQDAIIRPFFHGNQYFLFITETYRDVRLVGTPPASIGKFGADTDNWEWPRHTGDFSLFRIYTAPDGTPAEYSEENVPMKPKHHLPVSLDGVEEDDFTLVFGFPGRTDEYLPSVAMQQRVEVINPIRIEIRDNSLAVLNRAMRQNPEARIQYAAKQARIANAWKKWKGESQGIEATDGIGRRKQLEADFIDSLLTNDRYPKSYRDIFPAFRRNYEKLAPYARSRAIVNEIIYRNVELFRQTTWMERRIARLDNDRGDDGKTQFLAQVEDMRKYYRDYNMEIDLAIAIKMVQLYFDEVPEEHQAQYAKDQLEFAGGSVETLVRTLFSKSFLTKEDVVIKTMMNGSGPVLKQLRGDYAYQFVQEILKFSEAEIFEPHDAIMAEINEVQKEYMTALMDVFNDRRFYPDANSTMRVTYGKVEGYTWDEDETYEFSTYLDGVMEKYVPGDYEFDVPERLRQLHAEKNYGDYADSEGRLPVCFLGSNHTTGGNSGSPAIDAEGNLIGLNFDRTWHSTMSDINYDPTICRNIMVDARYILFVIDKFAGAEHLVEEMTLVHPKS